MTGYGGKADAPRHQSERLGVAISRHSARLEGCQSAPLAGSYWLRIATEGGKPSCLLGGRREGRCTRPVGARHSDNMYSWTSQILQDQMIATLEAAQPREVRKPRKQK